MIPARTGAADFLEQELLEFSIVTVPANSEALMGMSAANTRKAKLQRELDLIRLMPSLSKQLRNFPGGGGVSVATAAAIDSTSARLDSSI